MTDLVRQEVATAAHTIVVKVGTRVLTGADGLLNRQRVETLAEELHALMETGRKVVLVTSGAVGAGMGQLKLTKRPANLAQLQAVAAVGQSHLVEAYDRGLRPHGRHAAQLLLTAHDLDDRTAYLNVRNTIRALFEFGALPIINENDTVSVDELQTTFGDNDRLAAMVTNLIRAPLLVLLSDVDGLYDGDPADRGSKLISTVKRLDESVIKLARAPIAGVSKGGMASKLEAARIATTAGENVIIANGRTPGVLAQIAAGDVVGTLFLAQGQALRSFKRWIGFTARPRGVLLLDDGAREAVEKKGKSLLAAGIVDATGAFKQGDIVSLADAAGCEFARGLTNYPLDDVLRIKGLKTDAIAGVLGRCPYHEVIHRDNMALTREAL
ncbi:MAG: glutamate 5-kinase [Planctomycetota bacterium]|nr:MAG: glutamate 5-kinase [Planctomycetota bacterium]